MAGVGESNGDDENHEQISVPQVCKGPGKGDPVRDKSSVCTPAARDRATRRRPSDWMKSDS